MHLEDAVVGRRRVGDDLVVGARLVAAAAATGCRARGLVSAGGRIRGSCGGSCGVGRRPILRPDRIVRCHDRLRPALREEADPAPATSANTATNPRVEESNRWSGVIEKLLERGSDRDRMGEL